MIGNDYDLDIEPAATAGMKTFIWMPAALNLIRKKLASSGPIFYPISGSDLQGMNKKANS